MEIHDCAFIQSKAKRGGAIGYSPMYVLSNMQVYRSSFEQCSANFGGAVLLSGTNQLVECHFVYVYQACEQWSAKPSFSSWIPAALCCFSFVFVVVVITEQTRPIPWEERSLMRAGKRSIKTARSKTTGPTLEERWLSLTALDQRSCSSD